METVGVEPTSESNLSPESTCLACVLDWAGDVHRQTAHTLRRLWFRPAPICEKGGASLLNGVFSLHVGEAGKDVVLN